MLPKLHGRPGDYNLSTDSGSVFFGKQFHYPLHGEKARIGPEAAAGPVGFRQHKGCQSLAPRTVPGSEADRNRICMPWLTSKRTVLDCSKLLMPQLTKWLFDRGELPG